MGAGYVAGPAGSNAGPLHPGGGGQASWGNKGSTTAALVAAATAPAGGAKEKVQKFVCDVKKGGSSLCPHHEPFLFMFLFH